MRALWLAIGWSLLAAIVWASLTPAPPKAGLLPYEDKLQHLAGYGTLMYWFCELYAKARVRAAYAAGFAALGVALEHAQALLGYREFETADMVANAAGVALGWLAALATGATLLARLERRLARRA